MRLRSIPLRTCVTLAREGKLISVARDSGRRRQLATTQPLNHLRGGMRLQISRKPFEEKLSKLQDELNDLVQFELEGFDTSKLKSEIENQIERLLQMLGREYE